MTEDPVRTPRRAATFGIVAVALTVFSALCPPPSARSQGVTTGTLAGIVTDSAGIPVANANVVAVHVPTSTQYRAITRGSGAYTLPNVRVGGPYRVTVSFIGFQPGTRENVFAALGETQRIDFRLGRVATQLGPVQVSARRDETQVR